MPKKKRVNIGAIKLSDVKVRKKRPPPTQVQKSPKDYDRRKRKQADRKEVNDE